MLITEQPQSKRLKLFTPSSLVGEGWQAKIPRFSSSVLSTSTPHPTPLQQGEREMYVGYTQLCRSF